MIITLLGIGVIVVVVIAIIGKMFVVMLSVGLLAMVGVFLSAISGNLTRRQAYIGGGIGLLIALASFLLLL